MGVTLTDVLLFGKAQSDDVDNATLVIYRRNILRWSALGGYLDIIVKGVSPISLPDAIANSLEYLKAFGGTEQRNIPQPYTQVNYVTNTAQTAVDTGIMIDFAKNYEFEVECRAVSGSWYILQSRASSSGNITGIHGATSGSTITLVVGNVTICTSAITRTVGNKLYVKATLNAGTATLYVKDETANTEDTQTGSYGTSQPNPTASVYLLGNAGGQYADVNSDIYMARIKENDTVVMDYVPARQVATAGFYDTVSGTFKTAITASSLVADGDVVPTPDTPMDIVSNNGVLKANINLYWTEYKGYQLSQVDGITVTENAGVDVSGMVDCRTIKSFKITTVSPQGSFRIFRYRADNTFINSAATASIGDIITLEDNVGFFRIQYNFTNSGVGTENVLIYNSVYDLNEIYTDGTVETIRVHGKNFLDVNSSGVVAGYLASDGSLVQSTSWSVSDYIPIKANTTFTYSTTRPSGGLGSGAYLACYDANRAFISTQNQGSNANKTFTTPAGTAYIKVSFFSSGNWQVELGSTATEYEEYFDGGTATAEMLLKVGDYQDVQEILAGDVTRKVGVKVLDGTENWTPYNGGVYFPLGSGGTLPETATAYCSHFKYAGAGVLIANLPENNFTVVTNGNCSFKSSDTATKADWVAWLAGQYNAGTPVILVYAIPDTIESVTGQTLQVQAGDNTLEITQASLNGLELEAQYQAAVSLTIQEVQDANLDPNVEVTIN